jgi:hypothetical protein
MQNSEEIVQFYKMLLKVKKKRKQFNVERVFENVYPEIKHIGFWILCTMIRRVWMSRRGVGKWSSIFGNLGMGKDKLHTSKR